MFVKGVRVMEYFISHIGYVLICGLFMAVLGIVTVIAGRASQKENERHGYDPAWDKSDLACAGCKFFQVCGGMSAMRPDMESAGENPVDSGSCGRTVAELEELASRKRGEIYEYKE